MWLLKFKFKAIDNDIPAMWATHRWNMYGYLTKDIAFHMIVK